MYQNFKFKPIRITNLTDLYNILFRSKLIVAMISIHYFKIIKPSENYSFNQSGNLSDFLSKYDNIFIFINFNFHCSFLVNL